MNAGKIVAIIVLVAIVGLIAAQRLFGPDEAPAPAPEGSGAEATAPPTGAPEVAQGAADADLPPAGESRTYAIDESESEVYWRIYRAGAAANLGHNHVISVGSLDGSVTLTSELDEAEWNLSFPVDALIVDDPELRDRYGEEFESTPSEEDKAGTKENMLTDRVLDGEAYPEIRLEGQGIDGSLADARLPVTIMMLGREIEQTFPASISVGSDSIDVSGEYRLTHDDLGMEPFSVFGGIMAVGDEIDFTYRLHAVAGD